MTLFVDDDGKAYHIYSSEDNLTLQIAELSDDYLGHTGRYIRIFPGGHNEAPAIFKKDGTYWMITSGCTGWEPNKARFVFMADSWRPESLSDSRYITEFTQLRRVDPPYTNWLLFSATVEAFLRKAGAPSDTYRIASALRKVEEWYVGDGWYSDGKDFAFDYYNSFVLHPMYIEPLEIMTNGGKNKVWNMPDCDFSRAVKRMQRFGMILERFISPEGTLPVFGRSITYRTGTLQPLALLAWREWLPKELPNGQVRAAMTAVIKRMFGDDRNFNEKGFLTLGFNGKQPKISDWYTNNGSLYMASLAFLPLGLPADHPFWTSPAEDWTSKKAWEGNDFPKDHAFH